MANDLLDVHVILDVASPAQPVNLGNLAIFIVQTGTNEVIADTTISTFQEITDRGLTLGAEATQIAKGFFAQEAHGQTLFVYGVPNSTDGSATTKKLETALGDGWEFGAIVPSTQNDIVAMSNAIEAYGRKFLVVSGTGFDGAPAGAITALEAVKNAPFYGNARTFMIGGVDAEQSYNIGAFVGAVGNKTPGSATWKFKSLTGSTAIKANGSVVSIATKNHVNLYVVKAGKDQTSEGLTLGGDYIDALLGDDWVRATLETNIQNLLQSVDKLSYDMTGIAQLEAAVTTVLRQATDNGIILVNPETGAGQFTVTAQTRDQQAAADISSRKYNGLSFTYTRAGAIHDVTIHGTIGDI